jgi:hypothetical protein
MSRLRNLAPSGWVTVGLVIGAIILPTAALAAFSDVRIVGTNGSTQAQVTPANQLRVAEIDPFRITMFTFDPILSNNCQSQNVPAGSSFMLKQAVIDAYEVNQPTTPLSVFVYAAKGCPGTGAVGSVTPATTGTTTIPFEPGIPIKSGEGVSVYVQGTASGTVTARIHLLGYTMPASAVPASAAARTARATKGLHPRNRVRGAKH